MKQFAKEVAEELNVKPEIVDKVITHFWQGVRYYMAHPFESQAGVLMKDFMFMKINYKRLKWIEKQLEQVDYQLTPKQEAYSAMVQDLIAYSEYWEKGNGKGNSRKTKWRKKIKTNEQQT